DRLAAGHNDIRLQIPAAHNTPFALLDKPLYPFEKLRFIFHYPFVKYRLVVIKHKAVIFLAKISRDPESRNGLCHSLASLPEPYRIQMRVTYKMDPFVHSASPQPYQALYL